MISPIICSFQNWFMRRPHGCGHYSPRRLRRGLFYLGEIKASIGLLTHQVQRASHIQTCLALTLMCEQRSFTVQMQGRDHATVALCLTQRGVHKVDALIGQLAFVHQEILDAAGALLPQLT